jgi:hypothetical protein
MVERETVTHGNNGITFGFTITLLVITVVEVNVTAPGVGS